MQVNLQKKNDMLNYLGTFFISQVSFMGMFVPFVIGFIEKREKEMYKKFVLYGISIITVIFKFSFYNGLLYFVNILIISSIFEFLKVKNLENIKNISLFSVILLSNVIYKIFYGLVLYDVVMTMAISVLTVIGYNFFEKFNFDFDIIDEKNFLMITALTGIILATISNVSFWNISLRNVFAIYIVLSFAYLKNIKYAVLSGLIIGTLGEMVNADMGLFIISLTLGGFIASLFKGKGKIATIAGFCLGNCILAYYLVGYQLLIAKFVEITIAGILMTFSEKKIQIATNIFVDSPLLLSTSATNVIDEFSDASNELYSISNVIDNFNEEIAKSDEDIFDMLKNDICSNCKFCEKCWEENYDNTMDDIFNYIEKIDDDMSEDILYDKIFKYSYCKDENRLKSKILLEYGKYKTQKDNISPNELKKCVSTQLKSISKYILDITNKAKDKSIKNIEQRIITDFGKNNLPIERALVNIKDNECEVELKGDKYELKNNITKSNAILSEILNKRMVNINQNGNSFRESSKLKIEVGIASKNARNQKISGDTYKLIDFLEDRYIMILSDGMGIGKEANQISSTLVELYTNMAESNVNSEMITTVIGSFAQYMSDSEKIITLDTTFINLKTGECEFIKIGGAPTFIIRKDSVDIIYSDTLPMGIFEEVEFYKENLFLESGDIIVSVTDGVIDSKREIINKEFWVSGFLKNLYIDEPQVIADELLAKTIENYNGEVLDDVSIVVQKIV